MSLINRGGLFRRITAVACCVNKSVVSLPCCASDTQLVLQQQAPSLRTTSIQDKGRVTPTQSREQRNTRYWISSSSATRAKQSDAHAPTKRARSPDTSRPRRPDHRRGLGALQQCETANNHLKNTALFHVTAPLRDRPTSRRPSKVGGAAVQEHRTRRAPTGSTPRSGTCPSRPHPTRSP